MTVHGENKEGSEVFLSNNEHFQVGDILEVTPVSNDNPESGLTTIETVDKSLSKPPLSL